MNKIYWKTNADPSKWGADELGKDITPQEAARVCNKMMVLIQALADVDLVSVKRRKPPALTCLRYWVGEARDFIFDTKLGDRGEGD